MVVVRRVLLGRRPVTWSFRTPLASLLLREVVLSSHHFLFPGWSTQSEWADHSERPTSPL